MKPENQSTSSRNPQRRQGRSQAAAILAGKKVTGTKENFFSSSWVMWGTAMTAVTLILLMFTPYTHQLDEIKNVLLQFFPPLLLLAGVILTDFSKLTWKRHGALFILGMFTTWMVMSWALNSYKEVGERVVWFFTGTATFTYIFGLFLDSESKLRKTVVWLVSLVLFSCIFGLLLRSGWFSEWVYLKMQNPYWQMPNRAPWITLVYTLVSASGELYSFVLNSDFYAAYLLISLPLTLSMFFVENRVVYKFIAMLAFFLTVTCIVISNSNDTYIATAVMVPFYAYFAVKMIKEWNFTRKFGLSFLLCLFLMFATVMIMMYPVFAATFSFKMDAFEGRRVLFGGGFWPWLYGKDYLRESISLLAVIFGVGPGGYRHYFPWFRRPDFFDQQINNVTTFGHNWYLDLLLETGLIGLLLFVAFQVRIFSDAIRQIYSTNSRTHLFYQLAFTAGLLGLSIQNYSSPANRWAVVGVMFFMYFGLSIAIKNLDETGEETGRNPRMIGGFPVYKIAKIAMLIFAGIFVFRCAFPGTGQAFTYWEAAKANSIGNKLMDRADWYPKGSEEKKTLLEQSRTAFELAIAKNPTFATSYYKLGHVYNQLGMPNSAIRIYEKLNEINPSYSEVHLNLGVMYNAMADRVIPDLQEKNARLGELMEKVQTAKSDELEKLKVEMGELSEELKNVETLIPQRQIEAMEKSYNSMKMAAAQSLKPNTQFLAGYFGEKLASIYDEAGQKEKGDAVRNEVKKYYRSIIEYKPKIEDVQRDQKAQYPAAQEHLIDLAKETGKQEEAIPVLQAIIYESSERNDALADLIRIYDELGQEEEKEEFLKRLTQDDPTNSKLRTLLAQAYLKAGDMEDYIKELQKIEVLEPADLSNLRNLEKAYRESGNEVKAKEYQAKIEGAGGNITPPALTPPTASLNTSTTDTVTNETVTTGATE